MAKHRDSYGVGLSPITGKIAEQTGLVTKRYQCITLGHTEALIQASLDKIEPRQTLIAVLWVNTSAVGIIETK